MSRVTKKSLLSYKTSEKYLNYNKKAVGDLVSKTVEEGGDNIWPTYVLPISLKENLEGPLTLLQDRFS